MNYSDAANIEYNKWKTRRLAELDEELTNIFTAGIFDVLALQHTNKLLCEYEQLARIPYKTKKKENTIV